MEDLAALTRACPRREKPTVCGCVQAKGGTIVHDDVDRVCGVLAVTRAFGNNAMKATVSAEPEVLRHQLQPYDRHVVIASDGVWDVLTNEDVVRAPRLQRSSCLSSLKMFACQTSPPPRLIRQSNR